MPVSLPPALEAVRATAVTVAALGVPAHVTVLVPWLEPAAIQASHVTTLRRIVAGEPAFDVELASVRSFPGDADQPGTVYLAPEPFEPFVRLIRAIWAAYADHPPYGGAFDAIVPHLTIADDAARLAEVEAIAAAALPARRLISEAWLIVEGDDDRWARRDRLALGRSSGGPVRASR